MRADQITRLAELSEKLADVVLEEADPDMWPGAGQPLAEVDQQTRGDRYWCKKNAAATFALLERTSSLLSDVKDPSRNRSEQEEADLDKQIKVKEKEAAKMLADVMKRSKAAAGGKP